MTTRRYARWLGAIVLSCAAFACERSIDATPPSPVRVAIVDTGVSRIELLTPVLDPRDQLSVAPGEDVDDHDGHGTKLASLVHLRSPSARLVGIKGIGMGGRVSDPQLAKAVRRAVELDARVVLLAMAGAQPLPLTRAAIADAADDDVLVVVAAGNNGIDLEKYPAYPAAYSEPNMVTVAATDGAGRVLGTSNRSGPATVLASGLGAATCASDGTPTTINGTSAASALVAGRAAEILATRRLSASELRRELIAGRMEPAEDRAEWLAELEARGCRDDSDATASAQRANQVP